VSQLNAAAAAAAVEMSQAKGGHLHHGEDLSSGFSASHRPQQIHLDCFPTVS